VRKLIKIALVALGIRALLRWWKRRREQQATPAAAPVADPADELRRKLAETRADDEADAGEAGDAPAPSVADRRADVHDAGRAALDEMKPSDEA
jgi:hypothetical protein